MSNINDNSKPTYMCRFEKAAAIGKDYSLIFSEIIFPLKKFDFINNSISSESINEMYDEICNLKEKKPGIELKSKDYVSIAVSVLDMDRDTVMMARKKCPYSTFKPGIR